MPYKVELANGVVLVNTIDEIHSYDEDFMNNSHSIDAHSRSMTGMYKNYEYEIILRRMGSMRYFCGYIKNVEGVNGHDERLYIPHGGYTANFGFDCAHAGDFIFLVNNDFIDQDATYKSFSFVQNECFKIIDSIIEIV